MQIGERVLVRAYKLDGTCYRWRYATVETVETDKVVVVTPAGHRVEAIGGGWASQYAIRAYYWPDKWYSVLEVYVPEGRLAEVYVNINSPVEIEDSQIRFTDYELDVTRKPPHEARIVDEDEFLEAAARYGYSQEFQQTCYQVAREAMGVANRWVAKGMPTFTRSEACQAQVMRSTANPGTIPQTGRIDV
jgi:protein associated with RNAse G/E